MALSGRVELRCGGLAALAARLDEPDHLRRSTAVHCAAFL
jgi:hypothetical protein